MNNGRDELYPISGNFSKAEFQNLESECKAIENKLNIFYGPKDGEEVNYFWNPIRVYVQSFSESAEGVIHNVRIGVHSSAAIACESRDQLKTLGYDAGNLLN